MTARGSQGFVATCAKGTEPVLRLELAELGIELPTESQPSVGAVEFRGDLADAYRVCLWSRVASRILFPIAEFRCDSADDLYDGMRTIAWDEHMGCDDTLVVDFVGRADGITHSRFGAQRSKDAVVDYFMEEEGRRPSVDRDAPDLRINVHVRDGRASVAIDLSGEPLHKRGYRRARGPSPLKENLAAAMLYLADWPSVAAEGGSLVDPMCGTGTLLIEAAMMAQGIAPGARRRFGFETWAGHDAAAWSHEKAKAKDAKRPFTGIIVGSDIAPSSVDATLQNAKAAGVSAAIRVERQPLSEASAPAAGGIVVTNPPYGERLGQEGELAPLYRQLGDVLKRGFPGWTAYVLTSSMKLEKKVGLRAEERTPLFNGALQCRLSRYDIRQDAPQGDGPGWRRASSESEMFANRLRKNRKKRKVLERAGVHCYRLYDADIPEFNVAVDWYDGSVRIEEFGRPKSVPDAVADRRLEDVQLRVEEVLGVDEKNVVTRVRMRRSDGKQHQKRVESGREQQVREGDVKFWVNLHDYTDTGIFLDDRLVRRWVAENSGERFLNLFAYTCTASVVAAKAGAHATSVDLSKTYIAWGERNFALNGLRPAEHRFLATDCMRFIDDERGKYDCILLGPPTHSVSARGQEFDVQRDHVTLIRHTADMLKPGGKLLFTTNLRTFELGPLPGHLCVTRLDTRPPEFTRRAPHFAFLVERTPQKQ